MYHIFIKEEYNLFKLYSMSNMIIRAYGIKTYCFEKGITKYP